MSLEQLSVAQYPLAKKFYKDTGYGGAPGRDEAVWVWREATKIIASVRLQEREGGFFLRALVVHPDDRRAGIGQTFLNALLETYNARTIYCFPYLHLHSFYLASGFKDINFDSDTVPIWYLNYYQRLKQNKPVLAMKWGKS